MILIIASLCAFRERNLEHSFHEPKFLSFCCIALCIIISAYIPTYGYVIGKYKAIIVAITMDLFAFTFMSCSILPNVYVAIMRHKDGVEKYPNRPGMALHQKPKTNTLEVSADTNGGTPQIAESSLTGDSHLPPIKYLPHAVTDLPVGEDDINNGGDSILSDEQIEKVDDINDSELPKNSTVVKDSDLSVVQAIGYVNKGVDNENVDNVD